MTNSIKLTLGKAAKEVGISKPSLSAAIKKGKISARKNEKGHYEIDPAELFRVYPPKSKTNTLGKQEGLSSTNPKETPNSKVLDLLLGERDKLIAEKEASIKRLVQEKAEIRQDLEDMKDQNKRITLLLEDKREGQGGKDDKKDVKIEMLERQVKNMERQTNLILAKQKEEDRKAAALKKQQEKEANKKGWFGRLFG